MSVGTDQGRRLSGSRRILTGLALTVAVVAASYVLLGKSALFDVERVEIYGLHRVTLAEVEERLGFHSGDPLLSVNSKKEARNLEILPWVQAADIERKWDGLITVDITERRAVALAMVAQDQWALIDSYGRVLTEGLSYPPDLPRLSGVHAAGVPGSYMMEDSKALLSVLGALPSDLAQRVRSLRRDADGEILGSLASGREVVFGDEDRLAAKVVVLVSVLSHLGDQNRNDKYIDVSDPPRVNVRPTRG
jgi:cell division septal protein FtsQ